MFVKGSAVPRRWSATRRWPLMVLLAMLAVLFPSPAQAQGDEGPSIFGSLKYENAEGEDVPVGGVEIEVDGVGTVTSDENGDWSIAVPADGEYSVTINVDTLPPGVQLRNPDGATNPAVTAMGRASVGPDLDRVQPPPSRAGYGAARVATSFSPSSGGAGR